MEILATVAIVALVVASTVGWWKYKTTCTENRAMVVSVSEPNKGRVVVQLANNDSDGQVVALSVPASHGPAFSANVGSTIGYRVFTRRFRINGAQQGGLL